MLVERDRNERRLAACLREEKGQLLERWAQLLDGEGWQEEQASRVKRSLGPVLEGLVDSIATELENDSSGTHATRRGDANLSEPCTFDEGFRALCVFRAALAQTACTDDAPLTPAQVRGLIVATDELATPLTCRLHDLDVQRLAAVRGRFVAMLGHDLRNPLNAVLLNATSLLRLHLEAREAAYVHHIVSGARRMAQMVTELLELATGSTPAEEVKLASEACTLAAICKEAVEEIRTTHPSRVITLDALADGRGHWDRCRLLRTLQNLLANAVTYGRADAPVRVRVMEGGGSARIAIHNEGAPIDETTRLSLFEPFTRGPEAGNAPGLGLGLYIARASVRAHGGDITVESSASDGTTFFIDLPLPQAMQKPRALVVDDEQALGRAMKRMLDGMGFDTAMSNSGEDAWDRIRRGERFALVVSDIQMPGMDGPAFLEAARCLWPEIDAKIIFVTGSAPLEEDRTDGIPCFAKPVARDFHQHVRSVLEASR